jgi:hypothetical protein
MGVKLIGYTRFFHQHIFRKLKYIHVSFKKQNMDSEINIDKIEDLLKVIESRISVHNEFKEAYEKQLAFDFNIFNFFSVGENKISEILAYFLNPNESHGQGNAFLLKFLEYLKNDLEDEELVSIKCEEKTDAGRKIDIFLRFKSNYIIAIENKIWAGDQYKQLRDYNKYLASESKDNYLLIYLNPYGHSPDNKSICEKELAELLEKNKIQIWKYTEKIFELLYLWISVSEADNVSFFLRQFKKFLEVKFLGSKTLKLYSTMETIIKKYKDEVKVLVNSYYNLQQKNEKKFDKIVKILSKDVEKLLREESKISSVDIGFRKHDSFYQPNDKPRRYADYKAFKLAINKGENKVYIHLKCDFINLYSSHYFEPGTETGFKEFAQNKLNKELIVTDKNKEDIVTMFTSQIKTAINMFKEY